MALAFFGSAASAGLAPEFHLEHRRDVILFIVTSFFTSYAPRPLSGCRSSISSVLSGSVMRPSKVPAAAVDALPYWLALQTA